MVKEGAPAFPAGGKQQETEHREDSRGRRRKQKLKRRIKGPWHRRRVGGRRRLALRCADRGKRRPGLADRRQHQGGRGDRFGAVDNGRDQSGGGQPIADKAGEKAQHDG